MHRSGVWRIRNNSCRKKLKGIVPTWELHFDSFSDDTSDLMAPGFASFFLAVPF